MKLTIIHPSIGRKAGQEYLRTWQMEPLQPAVLAGLSPSDVEIKFYDDRLEDIPYDQPADAVAISVETYTAKRAYQIASEFRKRKIPVIMGGFHATLCPEEVGQYAEAVVVGEAEGLWEEVMDDARHGTLKKIYKALSRPVIRHVKADRRVFNGKTYLPIGLVEAGRGCHFKCEFCAIQSFFNSTQNRRDPSDVVREIKALKPHKNLFFFVDDNITSNLAQAKALYRELIPLKIKWVGQTSINAAHDEEFLELIRASGCQALLIGFETLNEKNLSAMNKDFNGMGGGYIKALENLKRYRIGLYAAFIFGYDADTPESFDEVLSFAREQSFFIAAFNHLTPFPGTPLYARLAQEGRLLYDAWWLDDRYRYNMIPFQPKSMSVDELQQGCLRIRQKFYTVPSIVRRSFAKMNASNWFMYRNYFLINAMIRAEVHQRNLYPLGDETWQGSLIKAV